MVKGKKRFKTQSKKVHIRSLGKFHYFMCIYVGIYTIRFR